MNFGKCSQIYEQKTFKFAEIVNSTVSFQLGSDFCFTTAFIRSVVLLKYLIYTQGYKREAM